MIFRSTEVVPLKRRKFSRTRICDSDDENDEVISTNDNSTENETQETECSQVLSQCSDGEWVAGESESSSDSFVSDTDLDEFDTDEEDRINSFQ